MIRFGETLIIEVYEGRGRADEVKDNNGDFLMLKGLFSKILSDASWNLSRQTKKALPQMRLPYPKPLLILLCFWLCTILGQIASFWMRKRTISDVYSIDDRSPIPIGYSGVRGGPA